MLHLLAAGTSWQDACADRGVVVRWAPVLLLLLVVVSIVSRLKVVYAL